MMYPELSGVLGYLGPYYTVPLPVLDPELGVCWGTWPPGYLAHLHAQIPLLPHLQGTHQGKQQQ